MAVHQKNKLMAKACLISIYNGIKFRGRLISWRHELTVVSELKNKEKFSEKIQLSWTNGQK